jgi:hypothetical protein
MKLSYGTRILAGLVLTLGITACTDLNVSPHSELTNRNFEPEKEDIVRLVGPAYKELRWFNEYYGYVPLQEISADSYVTPLPYSVFGIPPFFYLNQHHWDENNRYITTAWSKIHNGVKVTNRILNQVNNSLELPDNFRTEATAELRALRAYYHYLLMDNFKSVPLLTNFEVDKPVEQVPRWKLYDFIVQELKDVIPKLPEEVNQKTYGRMTKWSAKTLLARVYLNSKVYVGTTNFDKVTALADEIIDSGYFRLDPNYRGPFDRNNQSSPEIIWAIPYDENNAPGNMFHMYNISPDLQPIYQMKTRPWGGGRAGPQFIDTYEEEDTRLEKTWLSGPQVTSEGDTLINFVKNVPGMKGVHQRYGFRAHKYEVYNRIDISSDVDFPIFRYAEVLMMKAEALLRTGSPGKAAQIVTRVRERAFTQTNPSKAEVTATELQSGSSYNYGIWDDGQVVESEGGEDIPYGRFLDELGWEFALEGHRRQDLIRFGVFTRKSWFKKSTEDPCKIVFPLPANALQEYPNMDQHPCYR